VSLCKPFVKDVECACVCALHAAAEPTNHLDIPSKEMLEEAIQAFEGSVIAVSHDRYFLRKIATRILLVRISGMRCMRIRAAAAALSEPTGTDNLRGLKDSQFYVTACGC